MKTSEKTDIQLLIARTLRWGVGIACALAVVGGAMYLWQHGGEPMKDYTHFPADAESSRTAYTTLEGIFSGVMGLTAVGWIQLGVVVLLLTPMMRVALSLVDFVKERDWLYAFITAVVLAVIIVNSIGGY
ncbi:MAG: DUF1634 domain-containing protein [Alloprevotella sp.]|nr:DUF1634 domain-containing protein [Alloprevotella sp.]